MSRPIYLDYNATTPVDPRVLDAMLPFLTEHFGNASSTHAFGYEAHAAVDNARAQVARLIGAPPSEIVFTGGGSESNNLAIKGSVFPRIEASPHVITTAVDHPATLNTLAYLRQRFAVDITVLQVDRHGRVSVEHVEQALRPATVLVSIMLANNEVGTLQPVPEIAAVTRAAGVLLHVDAAQAAGKVPLDVNTLGADLLSIAGHKLYAPKGIGALYVRNGVTLDALVHGSSQEHGLRAGTENVAGIVALGCACAIALEDLSDESDRLRALRDELERRLIREIPGLACNGHPDHRLPNTANVSFPGVSGQALLATTPDVAASTGSACHSAVPDPSPVLLAMGVLPEVAVGAVRLSLGRMTTEVEIERSAQSLVAAYQSLTSL
jgi:cysteine desulfurase